MVDTVYFVKSILPRAIIGPFQHFENIYSGKSVCISVCGGYQVNRTYCQVSLSLFFLSLLLFVHYFVLAF